MTDWPITLESADGQVISSQINEGMLQMNNFTLKLEPCLANVPAMSFYQFERLGYFCADRDGAPGKPVFNRTVALRDAWAKIEKRQGK